MLKNGIVQLRTSFKVKPFIFSGWIGGCDKQMLHSRERRGHVGRRLEYNGQTGLKVQRLD